MQTYWGGKWKEGKKFWVLDDGILEERLMLTSFPYPLKGLRMGLGPGIFQLAGILTTYVVLITLHGNIFSYFTLMCSPFLWLSIYIIWHLTNSTAISAPCKERMGSFCCSTRRVYVSQLPYISCQKRPTGHEGPKPSEADLALPLVYGQSSVCILFSLVTQY